MRPSRGRPHGRLPGTTLLDLLPRRDRRTSGRLARGGLGSRGHQRVTLRGEELGDQERIGESPIASENGETSRPVRVYYRVTCHGS